MKELEALLRDMLGDGVSIAQVIELALILSPVIGDLADGDAHLNARTRLAIMEAIQDMKERIV